MELYLVSSDIDLLTAWEHEFTEFSNVFVLSGDILSLAENTLIAPSNGFGLMDGGVEKKYLEYFGEQIQIDVMRNMAAHREWQEHDEKRPGAGGHLPVGCAVLTKTGDARIPYLISAPTMIEAGPVPVSNCFFAMSAALNAAHKYGDLVETVYCPGLATLTGRVMAESAAQEMARAYRKWLKRTTGYNS